MRKINLAILFSKKQMPFNQSLVQLVKDDSNLTKDFLALLSNNMSNKLSADVLESDLEESKFTKLVDEENLEASIPIHFFQDFTSIGFNDSLLTKHLAIHEEADSEVESLRNAQVEEKNELPISILKDIPQKINLITGEILEILEDFVKDGKINSREQRLLPLIREYVQLKKLSEQLNLPLESAKDSNFQAKELFQKLITTFERRENLSASGKYTQESMVSEKTLFEWLKNILADMKVNNSRHQLAYHNEGRSDTLLMPMTKTEQFTIHIQRHDQELSTSFERQVFQKFEQAIRMTQFLRTNQGPKQLIFHLKPDNLGEMMVRLVEIDGEMTARIIVTSEATRKALQSNIHQLKTVFSPHQVLIEKQEEINLHQSEEQRDFTEEDQQEKDEHFQDQKESKKGQPKDHQASSFKDLLLGKV